MNARKVSTGREELKKQQQWIRDIKW